MSEFPIISGIGKREQEPERSGSRIRAAPFAVCEREDHVCKYASDAADTHTQTLFITHFPTPDEFSCRLLSVSCSATDINSIFFSALEKKNNTWHSLGFRSKISRHEDCNL